MSPGCAKNDLMWFLYFPVPATLRQGRGLRRPRSYGGQKRGHNDKPQGPTKGQMKYKVGIIMYMRPANERRRYIVTSSLIGWAHIQIDPWESINALGDEFIGGILIV